ncbi:hypothetical protein BGZ59_011217 [Podila verticillata]|nr:hypothetical protein BGZ59_011217 [Podila verticillata]
MIYKTTPATTLYLHHRSEDNVAGYRYHDSDNDWIITREQDEQDVLDLDISELKEKKAYLQWKDVFWLRHQAAFDALKAAVTSAKVLYIFDSDLPISVETDASGFVLGAVLFQTDTHSGTLTHHLIVIISNVTNQLMSRSSLLSSMFSKPGGTIWMASTSSSTLTMQHSNTSQLNPTSVSAKPVG